MFIIRYTSAEIHCRMQTLQPRYSSQKVILKHLVEFSGRLKRDIAPKALQKGK